MTIHNPSRSVLTRSALRDASSTKVNKMPTPDPYETELLGAYEKGALMSVATRTEFSTFKAAARATAIKGRRVNVRRCGGL